MSDVRYGLDAAARSFDWATVHELCVRHVQVLRRCEEAPSEESWKPALDVLRESRRYDDLILVADALMASGVTSPLLRRVVAQSFVDRGAPVTARLMFEQLVDEAADPVDLAEAQGGVARCAKDLFVATTAPVQRELHLRDAYNNYRAAYDRDVEGNYWHGINAAALAERAAREGVALDEVDDAATEARRLAGRVLRTVSQLSDPLPWHQATACEAFVALGRPAEAIERGAIVVRAASVTAFAVNALLRQFTQIWQLDVLTPPGDALLPLLRAGLLARTGGDVVLAPYELSHERVVSTPGGHAPEKVFGLDRYVSLPWYRTGLMRCRSVCRIEDQFHNPIGTGFLVSGSDLGLSDADKVVLTNAHVLPDGVDPDQARVVFHALEGDSAAHEFGVAAVLWTCNHTDLDTSVLRLDGEPEEVEPVPLATRPPRLGGSTPQRAYVIGHPNGWSDPQFSLHDNEILDYDDTFMHYRSPTDHGSSGSPVFDNGWRLVGLHHAGSYETPRLAAEGGVYQANEAIRISAIRARLSSGSTGSFRDGE